MAAFALLVPIVLPLMGAVALLVLIAEGRPILYRSERMRSPRQAFDLLKFRTMRPDAADNGASGGHKMHRITPLGRVLRRSRLDELPQIWNVLVGDIGFVGPRPPLRVHVEQFPAIYARVLKARPGITGLATVCCYRREGRLLEKTITAAETEAIYARVCIPRKARLDAIWVANRSVRLDLAIMVGTVWPGRGTFRRRVKWAFGALIVAGFGAVSGAYVATLWFPVVESWGVAVSPTG